MQITIEKKKLMNVLSHVTGVVEKRTTIPILGNVLISANDDKATFSGTDLDIEISESVEAIVTMAGDITVGAQILYDIVRKLPDGADVELKLNTADDPRLAVSAGRSRFNLAVLPAGDFPSMGWNSDGVKFEIEPAKFARLIEKTRFAVSTEETRYYLNGIFMHATETAELRAVSTDGHRLALAEMAAPDKAEALTGHIVPRKTIDQIKKLLEDAEKPVTVQFWTAKICVTFDNAVLTSKLIDGAFPDYGRVIPKNNPNVMKVSKDLLSKAVDRVATISAEKTRSVKMHIEDNTLSLSVRNADSSHGLEELEIEYDGIPLIVGFNSRYMLEALAQIKGELVEIHFGDPASPTLVLDSDDAETQFVLMPLRV